MISHYFWNLLIALDQFANALLGGDPDETLSSRAARGARRGSRGWGMLCRMLHWFDSGHCEKSIELDEGTNESVKRPWGLLLMWILVLLLFAAREAMAAPANGPDYDAMRFWLEVILAMWALTSTAIAGWTAKTRANRESIQDVRSEVGKIDKRLSVVEADIESLPDHDDIGELHEKINAVDGSMKEIRGELAGVNRTLSLIHESLLAERNRD